MPEGHVTHRLAAGLSDRFAGGPVRSTSPQGRFADQAAELDGHPFRSAQAYGKNLFVHIGDGTVHVHLGLLGRLTLTDGGGPDAPGGDGRGAGGDPGPGRRPVQGQVRWRLENDRGWADLRGPQACRLIDAAELAAVTARLGPDPLRADADPDLGWARVRSSATPIGLLLMDQRVAAGVGNIFRAEVLYRHRIDPGMAGRALRRSEWDAIWSDLVGLMEAAVVRGRIDTVRPEHDPVAMGRAPRLDRHGGEVYVYRRADQPCLVCRTPIRTREFGGRNLFWCPRCKRPSRRQGADPRAARTAAGRTPTRLRPAPADPGPVGPPDPPAGEPAARPA
ncbi:Fpg/Nei family DNA glycosylase [Nakamurella sp.]|uniref:Fpg/Nei family DNA glycosylase n=1 Tax=Nakamurella sp. TaxID=1869182 RepID=UPI003B3BA07E